MTQSRGELTKRVKEKSKELLGYEIDVKELRLMPYLQYEMMNTQRLDPNRMNGDERKVLSRWREKGFMEGGASGVRITKQFWNDINEILFLSYVDLN